MGGRRITPAPYVSPLQSTTQGFQCTPMVDTQTPLRYTAIISTGAAMNIDEKILGEKFGKLTPYKRADPHVTPSGRALSMWHCMCDCGKQAIIRQSRMLTGKTRSCGCLRNEYRMRIHDEAAARPKQPNKGKTEYNAQRAAEYKAAGPGNLTTVGGVAKARKRQKQYGLAPHEYKMLFDRQGGACAICAEPPTGKDLAVDHDHITGRVRGLLCGRCNRAIGLFKDSIPTMGAAIAYLANSRIDEPPHSAIH